MSEISGLEDFSTFEISSIEDLDPSLSDGSKSIFEREVPIEIRTITATLEKEDTISSPILESIRVKVLFKGDDEAIYSIRLEFSSESDLFFHYCLSHEESTFDVLRNEQRLMINFQEFPNILIKMLNSCIREPKSFLCILALFADGSAKLEFLQNLEYKHVELMVLSCHQSDDETVQRHITFRYNSMKQKLAMMQNRLHEINNMVRTKNPSLLLQFQQKGATGPSINSGKLPGEPPFRRAFYN